MIQTQSQNNEIRQIEYKVCDKVSDMVWWKVKHEVMDKVGYEVRDKAGNEFRWKVTDKVWDD
jgi:hypothetical protein